ncbi:asparagine synthase-related protein [Halorubrum sp. Hd13]|uniref:asparagine synthase-related protein n=1 Tax=Halorubrum sp. Hd13 TaxID=1480728 RepID=UPI001BAF9002|nr:asparagine synthase-related protein [Halorubrum sp. Hd13]
MTDATVETPPSDDEPARSRPGTTSSPSESGLMNDELFGVFGDRERLDASRPATEFDRVVAGETVTIGLRGSEGRHRERCHVYEGPDGCCVVWGELFPPESTDIDAAEWVYERFAAVGTDAFDELNGAYLVAVEHDGTAAIAPDLLRSVECYVTDRDGYRAFGTDPVGVARLVEDPSIDDRALNQFVHFGVSFENRTLLERLRRVPFDAALGERSTTELERFVYRPRDGSQADHAADLAERLERAVARRDGDGASAGALASAGYDSRLLLATVSDIDVSYTLGTPTAPEVRVAREVATQYGVDHELLPVTDRYLDADSDVVRYTGGIRESLHIHHRGNRDALTPPKMYHGLFLDTVLRDHYVPSRTIDAVGHSLPIGGLESDPDPVDHYRTRLGFWGDGAPLAGGDDWDGTVDELFEESVTTAIQSYGQRCDSTLNAMAMLGIQLTPALPFRTQIADNHVESLIAADAEILDWHLSTPPEHRNGETFQRALGLIDDDILRHRPPDRPHESYMLNQIEGFLRRTLPGVDAPGTPWPDRDEIYAAAGMDERLFPDSPDVHRLPPRIKLRINDALVWLECATGTDHDPESLFSLD